jgi:Secretion system C-terminal sorting domain
MPVRNLITKRLQTALEHSTNCFSTLSYIIFCIFWGQLQFKMVVVRLRITNGFNKFVIIEPGYFYPIIKVVTLSKIRRILKRIFYIFIFIAGFHFSSVAQVKSTFINDDEVRTVKFYPNPAASFINFEFKKDYDKSYTLLIYNFIGKKMAELKPSEQKITVPLTEYYRGVYIFQLRDAQGNVVESGKFQVVK